MSAARLPKTLDLKGVSAASRQYVGAIESQALTRLAEAVEGIESEVRVDMQVDIDESGRPIARGRASVSVTQQCERCLTPFEMLLEAPFGWCMVGEGVQSSPPEGTELLEVPLSGLPFAELVEEELLLALSLVPRHPRIEDCDEEIVAQMRDSSGDAPSESKRENPFAALEALKKKRP